MSKKVPQKPNNKDVIYPSVKGLVGVIVVSLLVTIFIYWYENAKVRNFYEKRSKYAREHPIKKTQQSTTDFYKYIDHPTDTTFRH